MLPLGHIAGIPVEETALSFGPVLLASGGILGLRLRDRWARVRGRAIAFVALALLAVAVTGAAAAIAAAPTKVYVETDVVSQELAYRPHAIGLAADGTFAMTGIKYASYGGPAATATARAYVRGCTPNCARGKVYRPAATLRFESQAMCGAKKIYSKLRYKLEGALPADFRRQGVLDLRPAGPEGC